MNRTVFFALFIVIFLFAYGLLNFYVFWRFAKFFSVERGVAFWFVVAGATLSFLLVNFLHHWADNGLTRTLYHTTTIWMGAVFITACVLVLHELPRLFIHMSEPLWAAVTLGLSLILIVASLVAGAILTVKHVDIVSPKIPGTITIAQVSDVHLGTSRSDAHLARVVEKVHGLKPDAVVITGDLFDGPGIYDVRSVQRFDSLNVPIFFVTGNHEGFANKEMIEHLLSNTTIRYLKNEKTVFKGVTIIGIDDNDNKNVVAQTLRTLGTDASNYTILLYHRPSASSVVSGIDLMLSGHTHNGQIVPFNLLTALVERPVRGLHEKNGFQIYVSVGSGTWGPPMRLGSTNEITLITLRPE